MARKSVGIVKPDGSGLVVQDVSIAAINALRATAKPEGFDNATESKFLPPYVAENARPTYPRPSGGQ